MSGRPSATTGHNARAHVSHAGATIVGMSDAPIQHAFVSYVREDTDEVGKLVSVLQAASIPVWKDTENLWPGEDWQQKIRDAVEDGSLVFIACFSTNSVQKAKTYMNAELRLAIDQIRLMKPGQVWLLPVRLDACDLPDFDLGNNRTLNSLQRIDLFGPNRDENLDRLISVVMKIFGTSTTTSASVVTAIADSGNSERGPLSSLTFGNVRISGKSRLEIDSSADRFADEGTEITDEATVSGRHIPGHPELLTVRADDERAREA
jgi:TIR domain